MLHCADHPLQGSFRPAWVWDLRSLDLLTQGSSGLPYPGSGVGPRWSYQTSLVPESLFSLHFSDPSLGPW